VKGYICLLVFFIPFMFSSSVLALCSDIGSITLSVPENATIDLPVNSIVIGGQLSSSYNEFSSSRFFENCNSPAPDGLLLGTWIESTQANIPGLEYTSAGGVTADVFPTGIPGIGYALTIADYNGTEYIGVRYPDNLVFPEAIAVPSYGFKVRATYVSTGLLQSGSYPGTSSPIANLVVRMAGKGDEFSGRVVIMGPAFQLNVNASSCSVQNPSILVTLPTVSVSTLMNAEATAGGTPFQINLNCDPNVSIHATVSDATDTANITDLLALSPTSTAQGVALRIYRDNGQAILFGPDSSERGNQNQWFFSDSGSAGGFFQIPLVVKYVGTGESVTAGSVQSRATITMSYQ
jgi:type 1 fimbria pilin